MSSTVQFSNVTAVAKANVYFDGKVISHTLLFAGGDKKTLGVIFPGSFHFGTDKAERMRSKRIESNPRCCDGHLIGG